MNTQRITQPVQAPHKAPVKGTTKTVTMNNSRIVMVFDGQKWINTKVLPI